jgi:NAD(P)-dependent dehydrogenase (short-subunit alcohol dehydrogenase family)
MTFRAARKAARDFARRGHNDGATGGAVGGVLGILAGAYLVKRVLEARANRLAGRVVLVTGGSRGLGLLLAREFAQRGCKVAICARDAEELERARLGLERRGHEVYAAPCDVTDPVAVEHLIGGVLERYGRLDVLVNNAGIIQVGPLDSMSLEDFHRAMDVNFWGTVHATLAALDALRGQPGGRVVNICSIGGKVAVPHLLPYDCAKSAVMGFSDGLRAELARDGISVTTVIPGLMRTGSSASAQFKGDQPAVEYQWFSGMSRSHATTVDGRTAARAIVDAAQRRAPEIILGWQARMLAAARALVPSTLSRALATANRYLPRGRGTPDGGQTGRRLALAANRDRWH